eukprot:4339457-Amphidinium_carterae.1
MPERTAYVLDVRGSFQIYAIQEHVWSYHFDFGTDCCFGSKDAAKTTQFVSVELVGQERDRNHSCPYATGPKFKAIHETLQQTTYDFACFWSSRTKSHQSGFGCNVLYMLANQM